MVPHVYGPCGDPSKVLTGITNLNRAAPFGGSGIDSFVNSAIQIGNMVSRGLNSFLSSGLTSKFFRWPKGLLLL